MRKGSASRRCMPPVSAGVANPIVQRIRQSHLLTYKHPKTTNAVRYVEIRRHCREPTAASLAAVGFASDCFFATITLQCRAPPLGLFCLGLNRVCRRTWAHVTCEGIGIKIDLALYLLLYHDRLVPVSTLAFPNSLACPHRPSSPLPSSPPKPTTYQHIWSAELQQPWRSTSIYRHSTTTMGLEPGPMARCPRPRERALTRTGTSWQEQESSKC